MKTRSPAISSLYLQNFNYLIYERKKKILHNRDYVIKINHFCQLTAPFVMPIDDKNRARQVALVVYVVKLQLTYIVQNQVRLDATVRILSEL